ncbi:hypothetical protein [Pedobacter xixiisoli]|uniref:Uncharacterized protein n=1 Tax=Pedobacter xixiisoli TaxID=1476464 RepID=A0A285ZNL7_9SPHI|nr:hypothetical protein [Pedobacter xixiisoli]SOD11239.1 hypothetical protein SAMN06297358_0050 [Pedobacter xixiisoli]
MKKNILTLCLLMGSCIIVNAQKSAKENYHDFTVYRTTKGSDALIKKVSALLEQKDELTGKQLANVEYHLGRMYEEVGDSDNALLHYTESIKGEPNYVVIHRAMGFIYLNKTKVFVKQMNEASAAKNVIANSKAFEKYKAMVQKALPHLEKYQACEPDEQTLTIITNLYKSIKEQQAIATLSARLKPLAENCVSLLEDE